MTTDDDSLEAVRRLRPDRVQPDDPVDPDLLSRGRDQLNAVIGASAAARLETPAIYPRLAYADEMAALDFLTQVFGLRERREARQVHPEGTLAWLETGGGVVMIGRAGPHDLHSPAASGGPTTMVNVYVNDIDSHYRAAVGSGARIAMPLEDMFWGERRYEAYDLEGHRWHFAERHRTATQQGNLMRELTAWMWVPYAIHAIVELGIADALGDHSNPRAIAEAVGADPGSVERLLSALLTVGITARTGDGYALTATGALLRTNDPQSMRDQVLLTGSERSLQVWAHFADSVRTGQPGVTFLDGTDDPFAWFAADPDRQAGFDRSMAEATRQMAAVLTEAYDWSAITSIVDVGGGYGALLLQILGAHPAATGIVFDREHCRKGAEAAISQLAGRCQFVGGDFFQSVPAGADAYVLKSVIHDWNDERATTILRNCRKAMRPDSRLLLVERVLPERLSQTGEHRRMMWTDLNMMVATGGQERDRSAYERLLATAGLRLLEITPTSVGVHVVEAEPTP